VSRPSRPFPASFDGRCALCDDSIYEGDEIQMLDGEACHVECVEDES